MPNNEALTGPEARLGTDCIDNVTVEIWPDEEGLAVWVSRDEDPDWTGVLPAARFAEFEAASELIKSIVAEAVATSGRDEEGVALQPCRTWDGGVSPARVWYQIQLAPNGTDDTWPVRPVTISPRFDTRSEAEALLANLAANSGAYVVSLYSNGSQIWQLSAERLTVERVEVAERVWDCSCGWSRDAHNPDKILELIIGDEPSGSTGGSDDD